MQLNDITLYILFVVFISTIFRSAFGFGGALISVPLLSPWISLTVAVPLSVFLTITVASVVVIQDWDKIHLRSVGWLLLFTLIGIPVGIFVLLSVNERIVKTFLGFIIIAFSIYLLTGKKLKELKTENLAWLFGCGLFAGILGGAYGLNGPPVIIYGAKRGWSAGHFRASLQAYFLIASTIGMMGYWHSGLLNKSLMHYYLLSIPVTIPAVFAGRLIHHRLQGERFYKATYLILLAMGIFLLASSVIR